MQKLRSLWAKRKEILEWLWANRRLVVALCFSVLFDLSIGLFCAYGLGKALDREISVLVYLVAMFLALVPDFDVLHQKLLKGKVTGEHKNAMHYPLFILSAMVDTGFVISGGSPFWTLLFGLCPANHLAHDMCERGPGVALGAPFWKGKWRRPRFVNGKLCFKMTPAESAIEDPMTIKEWLEREYMKPTVNLVVGVIAFLSAVIVVFLSKPPLF
ncbi:MAG: metal-dependent hydrolase [Patescibacteria group bacterium]